jgi:hypothetical protein
MSHKDYFRGVDDGEKFAIAYGIVNDLYRRGCAAEILADHNLDAKKLYEFYLEEVFSIPDYEYKRFEKLFKKEEV